MKLMHCPGIGFRPLTEYVFGGEVRTMPDTETCSDGEWADYVYNRQGVPGTKHEWWFHQPSGTWLIVERNTTKDDVLNTWLATAYWQERRHD